MPDGPAATVVICHFNPTGLPYLRHLALLCAGTLALGSSSPPRLLLCDGSPDPDPELAAALAASGAVYLHDGRRLSFGATYNLGVAAAASEYVVLLANDVLITGRQIERLLAELRGDVTCAVPYLTRSDYATQVRRRARPPRRCYPSSMTINVNAFRRDSLLAIGGVPEALTGCFNDMVIFDRLRARGERIALVNVGEVDHLRAVTRRIASDVAYRRDLAALPALAPNLCRGVRPGRQANYWARLYANAAQRPLPRLLWRLVSLTPWQLNQQRGLAWFAAWLEPYLAADWRDYAQARRPAETRSVRVDDLA